MSIINTNLSSLNAQRNLTKSGNELSTSMQRLSSGLRVNSAKDDAAGMSIATKMDSQIRGMSQASRNANDGISMIQTADGALSNISDALQRMRELAVQGANETNGTQEWENINSEISTLNTEIGRIASDTKFNGVALLTASSAVKTIQVGADSGQKIDVTFGSNTAYAGVSAASVTVTDETTAATAIANIDKALEALNKERASLGTSQNRMGYAISNLATSVENQSAAKSRITDTDYAAETSKLSRAQILQQAGTAMLAQANSAPNNVMSLLRG
ncbi:flagellin [Massilia sp. YIM B02769]|jgi:flagellin|uniref:flagellin N-terminal helical domain-containing protein n=1 Tax=unclassified Massilia TaxID=2609279 RepID=UPI0025B6C068|nr:MULTISPECIES: flagellin [unclassified Massilia]MDN4057315.1 flagellin [Massilia sp. YIM B02769]